MVHDFRYKFRVNFHETDMAGIAHFANYFRYMELAEHAFLASLGTSVHDTGRDVLVAWPRVHTECTFSAPLRFNDEVEIHLVVCEKRHRSIRYGFLFYKQGAEQPVAQGSVTVVCVAIDADTHKMKAVAIPDYVDRLIETAPAGIIEKFANKKINDAFVPPVSKTMYPGSDHQLQSLRRLLTAVAATNPFYQHILRQAGVSGDLPSLDVFFRDMPLRAKPISLPTNGPIRPMVQT